MAASRGLAHRARADTTARRGPRRGRVRRDDSAGDRRGSVTVDEQKRKGEAEHLGHLAASLPLEEIAVLCMIAGALRDRHERGARRSRPRRASSVAMMETLA